MAVAKKKKRLLSYIAIIGGLAVLSLSFFTVSQYEKAKCNASIYTLTMCEKQLKRYETAYKKEKGIEEVNMEEFIKDDSSPYRAAAEYWDSNARYFRKEVSKNSAAYNGTSIPAYLFSVATLVSFGLILKHAEKAKEKEDEEAVLQP